MKEIEVREVMVKRKEMGKINEDKKEEKIVGEIMERKNKRVKVWREDIENIIGIIKKKEMMREI